jgi:hypothetical protein
MPGERPEGVSVAVSSSSSLSSSSSSGPGALTQFHGGVDDAGGRAGATEVLTSGPDEPIADGGSGKEYDGG